jgi:rubrerythrin
MTASNGLTPPGETRTEGRTMDRLLTLSEILEIAIRIEQNGEAFYRKTAAQMKDPSLASLFQFLADEDVKHRKIFESMLSQADTDGTMGSDREERQSFLQSYAGAYIFSEKDTGKAMAERVKTPAQAVKHGIDVEIESMLYYLGFRKYVNGQDREMVDAIIDEEHSHYVKLLKVKNDLKGIPK